MRDRLVHADLAPELLSLLRVLHPEVERLLRDANGLERERGEPFVLGPRLVEERLAEAGTPALLEQDRLVDEAELGGGDVVAAPAAVAERLARLAAQQLLLFGEGELHLSAPG